MTITGEINQDKTQTGDKKPPARQKSKKERRPPKKITPKYLHNSGLAYLQRFPASTSHFRTVMGRKIHKSCTHHTDQDQHACMDMLEPVIENFQRLGLLDDTAYLRGMVTSLRGRGLSRQAILSKLISKGLNSDDIIRQVETYDADDHDFDEHRSNDGEFKAALKLARRKRLGPFRKTNIADQTDRQKELAKLARAGFSYDISSKIINMNPKDLEDGLNVRFPD